MDRDTAAVLETILQAIALLNGRSIEVTADSQLRDRTHLAIRQARELLQQAKIEEPEK